MSTDAETPPKRRKRVIRFEKILADSVLHPKKSLKWLDEERPKTRAECENGPRPCPWAMCRHHLFLEVTPSGGIKFNYPDKELWELDNSCSLDLADEGPRRLIEVGKFFAFSRERTRQIETQGILHIKEHLALKSDE